MNRKQLKTLVPVLVLVIVTVGFVGGAGMGTLSAFGWEDVSLLCPLGALTTMLASKTIVPRAVISLIIMAAIVFLVGRSFCGWVCPVPLVGKLRGLFTKKEKRGTEQRQSSCHEEAEGVTCRSCKSACSSETKLEPKIDSRHLVLGGALLSATVFGFPVFCLICPIGLTFATIFLVVLLFTGGDITWSVVVVPALLIVEVVFFKKWCSHICPLSAFMSLIAKGNKTLKPYVDTTLCLKNTKGIDCGKCASVCEVRIDPARPEEGASMSECTRCGECKDACPVHAISFPFLPSPDKLTDSQASKR